MSTNGNDVCPPDALEIIDAAMDHVFYNETLYHDLAFRFLLRSRCHMQDHRTYSPSVTETLYEAINS